MDQIKTGLFIKQLRCEKQLTQQQLGEILSVSNKSVSRWENGVCMPDIDLLLPLCRALDTTVTELLCGEKQYGDSFKTAADNTAITLLKSSCFSVKEKAAFFRRKWIKEHTPVFIIFGTIYLLAAIFAFIRANALTVSLLSLTALIMYIIFYNRMMSYIENHIYTRK